MLSYRIRTTFVAVSLLALLATLAGVALATNEYDPANCAPLSTCGSCLEGVIAAAQCTQTGYACIVYQGTAGSATFQVCVASASGGVGCQAIPAPSPYLVCGSGNYWTCGCRSQTTGDCAFSAVCNCVPGGLGGTPMASYTVNATC